MLSIWRNVCVIVIDKLARKGILLSALFKQQFQGRISSKFISWSDKDRKVSDSSDEHNMEPVKLNYYTTFWRLQLRALLHTNHWNVKCEMWVLFVQSMDTTQSHITVTITSKKLNLRNNFAILLSFKQRDLCAANNKLI